MNSINKIDSYVPLLIGYQKVVVDGKSKNKLLFGNIQKIQIYETNNQSQPSISHCLNNKLINKSISKNNEKVINDDFQSISNNNKNNSKINNCNLFEFKFNNIDVNEISTTKSNNLIDSKTEDNLLQKTLNNVIKSNNKKNINDLLNYEKNNDSFSQCLIDNNLNKNLLDQKNEKDESVKPIYLRQIYSKFNEVNSSERPLIEDVILEEFEPDDFSLSKSIESENIKKNTQIDSKFDKHNNIKHKIENFLNTDSSNSLSLTSESQTNQIFMHTKNQKQQSVENLLTNNFFGNSKLLNNTPNQINYEEIVAQKITNIALISGVMSAAEILINQIEKDSKKSKSFNKFLPSASKILNNQNNSEQKINDSSDINQLSYNNLKFFNTSQKFTTNNESYLKKINSYENEIDLVKNLNLTKSNIKTQQLNESSSITNCYLSKQQSDFSNNLKVSTTPLDMNYSYSNDTLNNKLPTPLFDNLNQRDVLQNNSNFSPKTLSRINNINVVIDPIKGKKGLLYKRNKIKN